MFKYLPIFILSLTIHAQNGLLSIHLTTTNATLETNLITLDAKISPFITILPPRDFRLRYIDLESTTTNGIQYTIETVLPRVTTTKQYGEALKYYFHHDTNVTGARKVDILLQNDTQWDFSHDTGSSSGMTFDSTLDKPMDHHNQNESWIVSGNNNRATFYILDAEVDLITWGNTNVTFISDPFLTMGGTY
jgi:hypothetical protein